MSYAHANANLFANVSPSESSLGRYDTSEKLFVRAQKHIPGGVNSPVRAFHSVGGTPLFIAGAHGAIVQDMDGHQYVDYVGSWGPMILGHANEKVIEAVKTVADGGLSFGAPTDRETALADMVCARHPSVDMLRLVNSGTEATMSAIRLARGFTGKKRILKFEGCYHGHADSLLVAAGSGLATHGTPTSAGVPEELAALTCVVPYNDLNAVEAAFEHNRDMACIIVEPVAGNMGCIPPQDGFLKGLRDICDTHGALLIFDEVMTGFRVGYHSAQGLYGIRPDITCFGKIIGGGLPLAAYGGKKEIMEQLSPLGPVYQAGTLSGNPLAVAAGLATLDQLSEQSYNTLQEKSTQLTRGLKACFKKKGLPFSTTCVGGMFGVFFAETPPQNFKDAQKADGALFKKVFHALLENGVYWPPSAYESCFMSLAHDDKLVAFTLEAVKTALKEI